MLFGKVDINTKDVDWSKVSWKAFQDVYANSLKGKVTETAELIAEKLGVKVPLPDKKNGGNA